MEQCSNKSVGAVIKRSGKILLIDRVNEPLGWACPAGHVDAGKTPEEMVSVEVKEEVGLTVRSSELALEETVSWNNCWRSNDNGHHWRVYEIEAEGEVILNNSDHKEANGYGWFSPEEIQHLNLEPVWRYWLEKLDYISASHKCYHCVAAERRRNCRHESASNYSETGVVYVYCDNCGKRMS